jgi:hypothetical protein
MGIGAMSVPLLVFCLITVGLIAGVSYGILPDWLPPRARKLLVKVASVIAAAGGAPERRLIPSHVKYVRRNAGICMVLMMIFLIVMLARNGWRV